MNKYHYFVLVIAATIIMTACTNESNTAAKGVDSSSAAGSGETVASPNGGPTDSSTQHTRQLQDSSKKLEGPAPDTADLGFLKRPPAVADWKCNSVHFQHKMAPPPG